MAYNSDLIEELSNTCALNTVGARSALRRRYIPFRPLKVCPVPSIMSSIVGPDNPCLVLRSALFNRLILLLWVHATATD